MPAPVESLSVLEARLTAFLVEFGGLDVAWPRRRHVLDGQARPGGGRRRRPQPPPICTKDPTPVQRKGLALAVTD